jgi:3-phenylpropionate/cinnamic acid dioxygenase small subunit
MPLTVTDRLAIHDLLSLHGHLVDNGELDRLDELFTDDVVYDVTALGGTTLSGVDAIAEAATQLGDRNPVAHHVTNILVADHDGEVTVRSKFIGIGRDGSAGSGTYDDVLRHTPDGWRIARRRITVRRQPLQP